MTLPVTLQKPSWPVTMVSTRPYASTCATPGPCESLPIGHGRQVRGRRGDYWYACISDFELFELAEQRCRTGQIKVVAIGPVSSWKLQVRKPG